MHVEFADEVATVGTVAIVRVPRFYAVPSIEDFGLSTVTASKFSEDLYYAHVGQVG